MGGYFKPLRRKFGLLTLVMACVLMAGWLRSQGVGEELRISSSDRTYHLLFSSPGWLGWIVFHDPEGITPAVFRPFYGRRLQNDNSPFAMVCVHWDQNKNQFSESFDAPNPHLIMPYSSVVVPLTLISLWLLLAKPRKSTPKKISEPIPAEGT